jgi:hypothetical protein
LLRRCTSNTAVPLPDVAAITQCGPWYSILKPFFSSKPYEIMLPSRFSAYCTSSSSTLVFLPMAVVSSLTLPRLVTSRAPPSAAMH